MPVRVAPWLIALLAHLLLWGMVPLGAQVTDSVTGRIQDRATGDPVSGAVVEVRGIDGSPLDVTGRQALTGSNGRFVVSDVVEGTYLIRVQHLAYGEHTHPLRLEGGGIAEVEILLSAAAIELAPVMVAADAVRGMERLGSPSSRNVRTRDEIAVAAQSGVTLGDYLRREVGGISVRSPAGGDVGGYQCIEFRGARRADGRCRPPEVRLDGTVVPNPLNFFGDFSLEGLERIQVIPPAEAGGRFGTNGAWGVILLETRRPEFAGASDPIPVARRRAALSTRYDWSLETDSHSTATVYTAAFLGNAVGLAAAGALLSRCMDLETRTFHRGELYCGHASLLGTSIVAAVLPPLTASLAAKWAGTTSRSSGQLSRSLLYSLPAFVPGFALASVSAGDSSLTGLEATGLALIVFGAPMLNTVADRLFRNSR